MMSAHPTFSHVRLDVVFRHFLDTPLVLVMQKFIYVENVGSDNVLTRAFQQLIESIGKLVGSKYRVTRDVLPFVQVPIFSH